MTAPRIPAEYDARRQDRWEEVAGANAARVRRGRLPRRLPVAHSVRTVPGPPGPSPMVRTAGGAPVASREPIRRRAL